MKTLGLVSALSWLVVLAGSTALAPVSLGQSDDGTPKEVNRSKPSCPAISVSCPGDFKTDEPLLLSASITGAVPETLTYAWTVVGGTIIEGQGTPTLKFQPSGGNSYTGTLSVGGLDPSCASTASCSLIVCPAPPSRKFDSFGFLPGDEVTKRLGKFADALVNHPGTMAYVLFYGRRAGAADEAKVIAERAKTYLVSERSIQNDRVVTIEGGVKDQTTIELWLVPSGATPPKASDDANPGDGNALPDKKTPTNPTRP